MKISKYTQFSKVPKRKAFLIWRQKNLINVGLQKLNNHQLQFNSHGKCFLVQQPRQIQQAITSKCKTIRIYQHKLLQFMKNLQMTPLLHLIQEQLLRDVWSELLAMILWISELTLIIQLLVVWMVVLISLMVIMLVCNNVCRLLELQLFTKTIAVAFHLQTSLSSCLKLCF